MAILTRAQLDGAECTNPECTEDHGPGQELYFHSICHEEAPCWVRYHEGVMHIECAECGSEVAAIQVAEGLPLRWGTG